MSELLEQWMEVSRHEASTADRYADLIRVYLLPTFGSTPAGKVDADLLEQFYGRLLRCRKLCSGTRRTNHECEPLAPNTVGKIHFIIRSAPGLGVRWRHLGVNEAEIAHRTPSCVRRYRRGTCAVLGSSSASGGWAAESKGRVVAEILVWTCGPVLRPATYSGCSHCTHSAALGRFG